MTLLADTDAAHARLRSDKSPVSTSGHGTGLSPVSIRIEVLDHEQLIAETGAWQALIGRVLEPNVFLEPGFILPLLQNTDVYSRLRFLAVWLENASTPRLIGLFPFFKPRFKYGVLLNSATTAHSPLGTPLLDRDHAGTALQAFCDGLRQQFPLAAGFHLPFLPVEGSAFLAMAAFAKATGREISFTHRFARAGLFSSLDAQSLVSSKRRKFYRQQRHQLEKLGSVTYERAADPQQLALASEEFLALEAEGWKGRRHTAFLSSPSQSAFFRASIKHLALQGKCRIDSLRLDGRPIAMGIVLKSGDQAAFWKTCFDERFAWLSPGAQLTLELTQSQLADPAVSLTDSCAVPDHPMINHIWRQRIDMADVLLPLRPRKAFYLGQSALLGSALAIDHLPSTLRRMAKILLKNIAGLRPARRSANAESRAQTASRED